MECKSLSIFNHNINYAFTLQGMSPVLPYKNKKRMVFAFAAVFNIHIMNRVLITKKKELGMVRLGYTGIKLIYIGLGCLHSPIHSVS